MQKVIIWRYPHHTLTNLECKPESRNGKLSFDRSIGYFCSIRHFCCPIRHSDSIIHRFRFMNHSRFIRHSCCSIRHSDSSLSITLDALSTSSIKKSTLPIGSVVLFHIYFTARMKMRSLSYSGASSVKSDVTSTSLKPMSRSQVIYCSIGNVR